MKRGVSSNILFISLIVNIMCKICLTAQVAKTSNFVV